MWRRLFRLFIRRAFTYRRIKDPGIGIVNRSLRLVILRRAVVIVFVTASQKG
jgi:hypothetical protein